MGDAVGAEAETFVTLKWMSPTAAMRLAESMTRMLPASICGVTCAGRPWSSR